MKYQGINLPIEVILEHHPNHPIEGLRWVARIAKDPEYSKMYGRTKAEALGQLILVFNEWPFPMISIKENERELG